MTWYLMLQHACAQDLAFMIGMAAHQKARAHASRGHSLSTVPTAGSNYTILGALCYSYNIRIIIIWANTLPNKRPKLQTLAKQRTSRLTKPARRLTKLQHRPATGSAASAT